MSPANKRSLAISVIAFIFLIAAIVIFVVSPSGISSAAKSGKPSAAIGVYAISSIDSAIIQWNAPSKGAPVTIYVASSKPGSLTCTTRTSTTCTITNLTAGKSYKFRVKARNIAGTGPWSNYSNSIIPSGPIIIPPTTTTTIITPTTTTTIPITPTTTTTISIVPPTTTTTLGGAPTNWWQPKSGANLPWQWYLSGTLDLSNPTEMGTNDTLPSGAPAPAPAVYDIDGIENPASTVASLEAAGKRTICYIEVGTAGNYYTAAQEGIPATYYSQYQADGDFGNKLSGYPEYFLNINSASTVAITESMIQQQCAAKGFSGVETDLDETFNNNEGNTGFTISEANEESYMTTLANYMHSLGLAWIIKNPDDVGDATYANAMYPLADGVITEQCNQYNTCGFLSEYENNKAIFNAEYSIPTSSFCPADIAAGINGALFNVNLNGTRNPCN